MRMLLVYCNSFWIEERTDDIFMRRHRDIQGLHSQVSGGILLRLDGVWVGEIPCSQPTLDVGYMLKVSDHAQFEEMFVLCSFRNLAGPCGV